MKCRAVFRQGLVLILEFEEGSARCNTYTESGAVGLPSHLPNTLGTARTLGLVLHLRALHRRTQLQTLVSDPQAPTPKSQQDLNHRIPNRAELGSQVAVRAASLSPHSLSQIAWACRRLGNGEAIFGVAKAASEHARSREQRPPPFLDAFAPSLCEG